MPESTATQHETAASRLSIVATTQSASESAGPAPQAVLTSPLAVSHGTTQPVSGARVGHAIDTQLQQQTQEQQQDPRQHSQQLDFIGAGPDVKSLFALPYTSNKPLAIAIHNIDGTLLVDDASAMFEHEASADAHPLTSSSSSPPSSSPHNKNATDNSPSRRRRRQRQQHHLPHRESESVEEANAATVPTGTGERLPTSESVSEPRQVPRNTSQAMRFNRQSSDDDSGVQESLALAISSSARDRGTDKHLDTESVKQALNILNRFVARIRANSSRKPLAASERNSASDTPNRASREYPLWGNADWVLTDTPPAMPTGRRRSSSSLASSRQAMAIPPTPREYLEWHFRDMNLLVGTDAMIVRPTAAPMHAASPSSDTDNGTAALNTALAIRVEDVNDMRNLLQRHQEMVAQQLYIPDYKAPLLAQQGKPSYAEAVEQRARLTMAMSVQLPPPDDKNRISHSSTSPAVAPGQDIDSKNKNDDNQNGRSKVDAFSAPNLDKVRLQTCIVPSIGPLGGLLQDRPSHLVSSNDALDPSPASNIDGESPALTQVTAQHTPLSIVLDAYLDNLMANVPQLALCLEEKGFIQSIKLMQTDDIPAMLMNSSTIDTSHPFSSVRKSRSSQTDIDEIFSPQIMEMNASALLRFLKANCTKNNATYLLSRDSGQANIQLYDISSISSQRQKKWVWWLATMSYRFALRLRHLESHADSSMLQSKRRSFRDRQRSLFLTTLDLLGDLKDMHGGNAHESLVASVNEHMADTYLAGDVDDCAPAGETKQDESIAPTVSLPRPVMSLSEEERKQPCTSTHTYPYARVSIDSLTKSQDYLMKGIKILWPVLEKIISEHRRKQRRCTPEDTESLHDDQSNDGDDDDDDGDDVSVDDNLVAHIEPVCLQLFGMHYKLINVMLRLAEHHLRNYFSSSAMQALRQAGRRISASAALVSLLLMDQNRGTGGDDSMRSHEMLRSLQLQYCWLWEHCGHFARSFAADELWRDRGHASGDDVVYVIQDAETSFRDQTSTRLYKLLNLVPVFEVDPIGSVYFRSQRSVSLQSLSGIVDVAFHIGRISRQRSKSTKPSIGKESMEAAKLVLSKQRLLDRDKRKVLVASCIAYDRAIQTFEEMLAVEHDGDTDPEGVVGNKDKKTNNDAKVPSILNLLQQRMGDACNESGKMMLSALRTLLSTPATVFDIPDSNVSAAAAEALLCSAHFWFMEGLAAFEKCGDLQNIALLRCNLCQCFKLRANSSFVSEAQSTDGGTHAEVCLQEAAEHLQAAHESLGVREVDPVTWDMVSDELAATFLVLAVRRRQSLLGGGNTPIVLQSMRLTPGKERAIYEPMERALEIYEQSGNRQQAAAVHYQLALTNSKLWTCQRDESKTREKLSAAFNHYNMAFSYYVSVLGGNEPTFVLLCLDLAALYSSVSAEEDCVRKALGCCLESSMAFTPAALERMQQSSEWIDKMKTLSVNVEDLVLKLLKRLAKLNAGRYKDMYRSALAAKLKPEITDQNEATVPMSAVHYVLQIVREQFSVNV